MCWSFSSPPMHAHNQGQWQGLASLGNCQSPFTNRRAAANFWSSLALMLLFLDEWANKQQRVAGGEGENSSLSSLHPFEHPCRLGSEEGGKRISSGPEEGAWLRTACSETPLKLGTDTVHCSDFTSTFLTTKCRHFTVSCERVNRWQFCVSLHSVPLVLRQGL